MDFFRNSYHKLANVLKIDLPQPKDKLNSEQKCCVIAFGNVLLDLSIEITDTEILERYGLPLETKGIIDAETLSTITEEIFSSQWKTDIHPGGSALNTVRILKQLGTKTTFNGAVGNDSTADMVREYLDNLGIVYNFQIFADTPTGKCVCFVVGDKTALYANIGASEKYSVLQINEEIFQSEVDSIFYIEGFFIPNRMDVCEHIVNQCTNQNKLLAVNLNAQFIVESNFDNVEYLLGYSLFVFGNMPEFLTLANMSGFDTVEDFAKDFIKKSNSFKIIVITNGSEFVQLISNYNHADINDIRFKKSKVPNVENIVDTTGAGDSFVAGFLHSFLQNKSLEKCLTAALDVASVVVQKIGCTYV